MNPQIKEEFLKQGFTELTPIQEAVYPDLNAGKSVLGLAPTGSGKTLAYTLPIIEQLTPKAGTQLIIIAPSQELAMQITNVVRDWVKVLDLTITPIIGGANVKRQVEKLKKRPEIIVGTPGRLLNLIQEKRLKMHKVKSIIIDEADDLLQDETLADCRTLVGSAPTDVQLAFFSATQTDILHQLHKWFGCDVVTHDVRAIDNTQGEVTHYLVETPTRKRTDALRRLANMNEFYGLVFFKKNSSLNDVYDKLKHHHVKVAKLSGEERKQEREQALKALRKREINLLLTTDVAARGLDIPNLPAVVNYDLPKDANTYIHRVGRTGRMGAPGVVINIGNEHDLRHFKQLVSSENFMMIPGYIYHGQLVSDKDEVEIPEETLDAKPKTPKKKKVKVKKAAAETVTKPKKKRKKRQRDQKNKGKRK
ncbi:DEAD/DEAH box helicase [Ligilactobacillus ceti]|uniref:ATP-dependent RNA helicase n=1 Tax=Ligilactobacillus ceti DSM 22408 TaxID=1122146 RepID=A0A0R2KLS1_9LACO|nr:DEAD/DEAH box helicase [Ligilactobacillus ceti]KRN90353.1 ATP-dependent RNA helicase [Ligilactobacillus ceti DSM 22408]